MQVVGDPEGIAALKAIAGEHRDYLKFLLGEAQSATDHIATFRGPDGVRWELLFHPQNGNVEVRRSRNQTPSVPPPSSAH